MSDKAIKPAGPQRPSLWRSLGPAIIVASVVLGPGSIVTNSKVGWQFGYEMVWVLGVTVILMIGMTALGARLGVFLEGTPCSELARRAGRPLAALTGITLFLIAACFQFGNNLGVLYALEPWVDADADSAAPGWSIVVLVAMNGAIIAALLGFRRLYRPVERFMKLLVAVMILGFAANLLLARPSLRDFCLGWIPSLPAEARETVIPRIEVQGGERVVADHLWAVQGVLGTTFSVAAAFYHAYLVRQKGWSRDDLRQGLFDSVVGIVTLGGMSMMVMVTAAAVLHGNPAVTELKDAAAIARQLQPLFGSLAVALFCAGIFAGALSSFLVNAMIGGTVLSDGLGWGGGMDDPGPKSATVLALLIGMGVAIAFKAFQINTGNLIVLAQALTVLGNPLLAGAMLWLATRRDLVDDQAIPLWIKLLASAGFVVVLLLSVRTAIRLYLQLTL